MLQESVDAFIFYCFLHLDLLKCFLPGITGRPLFAMMWIFFIFSYIKIQWVASIFVSATLGCYYLFKRWSLRLPEQVRTFPGNIKREYLERRLDLNSDNVFPPVEMKGNVWIPVVKTSLAIYWSQSDQTWKISLMLNRTKNVQASVIF